MMDTDKDPLGSAILDYFTTNVSSNIIVHSNIAEDDVIPAKYLFRGYEEMPEMEIYALEHCKGRVLDVGAGAGSHSLMLQQNGHNVTALEISTKATDVIKGRGVKQVVNQPFLEYEGEKVDTVLLMMNGIGLAGTVKELDRFFEKIKTILADGGIVIFDSSDIDYMYHSLDGGLEIDPVANYYGEVRYQMEYKNVKGSWFNWLFIDHASITMVAKKHGFKCDLLYVGSHHDYLAQLTRIE